MVNWIAMFLLPASMSFHHQRTVLCSVCLSLDQQEQHFRGNSVLQEDMMMVSGKNNLLHQPAKIRNFLFDQRDST
uniref:Putative secreted protein n=1 Tax=Anopheles marajoara TaxID=58244 RepID=A0A2M4CDG1_9DIPT